MGQGRQERQSRRRKKPETNKETPPAESREEKVGNRSRAVTKQAEEVLAMLDKAIEDYIKIVGEDFGHTYLQQGGE